jgi:lipopolysaccharide export system protein LptA
MKMRPSVYGPAAALAVSLLGSGGVGATSAEKPASSPASPSDSVAIFPGTNSKEPISIDADKLVYYDKEHKAIYSGNVIVIQGDTKMTCTVMTVLLDRSPAQGQNQAAAAAQKPKAAPDGQSGPSADSGVKHLEATGPVTVISKTQVATGDSGRYDKAENKVWLIGHVTLSDGQNVTKGDMLTYDLKTGQATIDPTKSGRVHGQFIQNSGADAAKAK